MLSGSEPGFRLNVLPLPGRRVARPDHGHPLQSTGIGGNIGGCECKCRYSTKSPFANLPLLPPGQNGCSSNAYRQLSPAPKEILNVGRIPSIPQRCAAHWIPPELLGIIFENCLDGPTTCRATLSESPLLFGRVCSYWRSVSHRTTRLWASFSLEFLETDVDRSQDGIKVAGAVETWLHRSYPSPLSISFTDHRTYQKDTQEVILWLLFHIRIHAPRWQAIHLKFSSDYFTQLSVVSSCAFTSLSSFSVHTDHMGWRSGLLSLRLDLSQATRLTSLAYTGPEHVIQEEIIVDWSHLTSAAFSYSLHESEGGSATCLRCFSTLALCQNLMELSIGLSTTVAAHSFLLDIEWTPKVIELPRLHTLRVRRLSRATHACALIDMLRLPRLSVLYIDSATLVDWDSSYIPSLHSGIDSSPSVHTLVQVQTHWWHAYHFSALLDRSACHLHTLHIQDVDFSFSELSRLLMSPSTSTTLSTLTLEPFSRSYPISKALVSLLPSALSLNPRPGPSSNSTSASIPDHPFPSLSKLRLSCAHETHLDMLANVIESRTGERAAQAGVHPLTTFELVFYDFLYYRRQGGQSQRKACFSMFKHRVLRCARERGVDVKIQVERPYEPVYFSVP